MTTVVTKEHAHAKRHYYRLPNGTDTWISSYVGINSVERRAKGLPARTPETFPPPLEPIAFLVEQGANSTIPGHYHQADQFQVFLAGEGKFGIKPIEGLTVHYAMAFTPYAPIHADHTGVQYLTLRNGWDPGARWMPEHREALKGRTQSYRHGLGCIPALIGEPEGPKNIIGVQTQTIVPQEEDGLVCSLYQATTKVVVTGPAPTAGRGQYWLVLRGQCFINGQVAGARALVFVAPDEAAPTICTSAEGSAILLMQFPKRVQVNND